MHITIKVICGADIIIMFCIDTQTRIIFYDVSYHLNSKSIQISAAELWIGSNGIIIFIIRISLNNYNQMFDTMPFVIKTEQFL